MSETAWAALQYETVLARVDGNPVLLRELASMFVVDAPQWLIEIAAAVNQKDVARLKSATHLLRGSLGIFGPSLAHEVARQLETLADSGCLTEGERLLAELETAMQPLQRKVARLVEVS